MGGREPGGDLSQVGFQIPYALDYAATFLWALDGGFAAIRKRYDFVGVFALALVTATGGGLIRDGLLLHRQPLLLSTPVYTWIVLAASALVVLTGHRLMKVWGFDRASELLDACGLGAYAIVGTTIALHSGIKPPGAVLIGVINAVGGGVLRDVLIREEPEIFKPGFLTATAALVGAIAYACVSTWIGAGKAAAWISIAIVFGLRILSLRYRLRTRPGRGPEP